MIKNPKTVFFLKLVFPPPPYPFERLDIPCFIDGEPVSYFIEIADWKQTTTAVTTPAHYIAADISSHFFSDKGFFTLWAYVNDFKNVGIPIQDHIRTIERVYNHSQRIGFTGMFLYMHPSFFGQIIAHATTTLLDHFADRSIFFFIVDSVPEYPNNKRAWWEYSQDHALLAAWGNDVYLTNFDRDEVLGLPQRINLRELVTTGCMRDAALIRTPVGFKFAPASLNPANKDGDFIVLRNEANLHSAFTIGCFPPNINYKNIFHPDGTLWINIHGGQAEAGYSDRIVSVECVFHAHLINYWAKRYDADLLDSVYKCTLQNDSTWLWMY